MMKVTYKDIVDSAKIATRHNEIDIQALISLSQQDEPISPDKDKKKTLLLAIDIQNDFMEDIGSLPVPGSRKDVANLTQWIFKNRQNLTQIMCSLDTHSIAQIFHACWWLDANNQSPAPFTIIQAEDVRNGKWRVANGNNDVALTYLEHLEKNGQKRLCIWPYHCIEATFGTQLETEFTKMLYFHSALHTIAPIFVAKGQNPYSEMYGIIKAEYDPSNFVNHKVLETIQQFDEIYIAGEASSHCVLASLEQILDYFGDNKDITSRITVLTDCMSPIPGFEEETTQRFIQLKEQYHIHLKESTVVVL